MTIQFKFAADACTGCLSCMAACIQKNAGMADPSASSLRVELDPFTGSPHLVFCRQCNHPICVKICPQKAIVRNKLTGAFEIQQTRCNRCGRCASACPFEAISFSKTLGPFKCNLCENDPRCIRACHFDVLSIERD